MAYVAEEITQGEDARKNQEQFLTRYIQAAGGTKIDNSLIKGITSYETHQFTLLKSGTDKQLYTIKQNINRIGHEFNEADPTIVKKVFS